MATSPSRVRAALRLITGAAIADTRAVAAAAAQTGSPADIQAALFAASPLIVGNYIDGSAALALEWYDELRDEARPPHRFTPTPLTLVNEDGLASSVAWATRTLYDLEQDLARMTEELLAQAVADSLALLEPVIQKDVAAGYRDTIVGNTSADPDAAGWKRFALPTACGFCRMLADKGAVYTESTATFAAHTSCHCIAGPEFGGADIWAEATPMQYVASQRTRTKAENKAVRRYLNKNYSDAPG